MKLIVEFLTDHGFTKLGMWLCERTGGHDPIWYNCTMLEPDMRCQHCLGEY